MSVYTPLKAWIGPGLIITVALSCGYYINKVQNLEYELHQLEDKFEATNKNVNVLSGIYLGDIDDKTKKRISRYMELSATKNIPTAERVKAIKILKTITPIKGIEYLKAYQNFNPKDASSIFEQPTPKGSSNMNTK